MNAAIANSEPTFFVGPGDLFREGLRRVLAPTSFAIERAAETLAAAWDGIDEGFRPRLVLVHAPAGTALDCGEIARLCRARANLHVVILADRANEPSFAEAVRAGVSGILLKRTSSDGLLQALRLILLGERVFPTELIRQLLEGSDKHSAIAALVPSGLSARERHILERLMDGGSNKAIARDLKITEATVKVHLKAILRKTGAANRTQAAVWAISRGSLPAGRPSTRRDPQCDTLATWRQDAPMAALIGEPSLAIS